MDELLKAIALLDSEARTMDEEHYERMRKILVTLLNEATEQEIKNIKQKIDDKNRNN